jgi:hypothetical protein
MSRFIDWIDEFKERLARMPGVGNGGAGINRPDT